MITKIILFLSFLTLVLFFVCYHLFKKLRRLLSAQRSLSTRYGKTTEQFLPFLSGYPYEPANFRFIGTPIDGLQFEDDKIVFVEFKTGNSQMTEKQKRIKELVEKKKIEFKEIRI